MSVLALLQQVVPHHATGTTNMALSGDSIYRTLIINSELPLDSKAAFATWADKTNHQLRTNQCRSTFSKLLESIPTPENSGPIPLASLGFLLSQYTDCLPTFEVLRCYRKLWLQLSNDFKVEPDGDGKSIIREVLLQVTASCGSLPSLLLSDSVLPALVDPATQRFLTHQHLSFFIRNFRLPLTSSGRTTKPVVALALPNGFQLGLACLAVAAYYTAAPLNIAGGATQLRSDVELARPQSILALESDVDRLGIRETWVSEAGIQVFVLIPNEDMTFHVQPLDKISAIECSAVPTPNSPEDFALILFTSGTSGSKKVVPITCFGLFTGISCVIDSWGLICKDKCLNMMPLNHVGGIVRNLFAPVLSGGSTILCSAFDPNLFWDLLEEGHGTWYYASPSMHMSILAEGRNRGDAIARCQLRLVCNAAGGLLPALAAQLRNTFNCTVLPSYGMTECMPISTPPLDYTLDRVGTSGIGCGPEIGILDESDTPLPPGIVGRINVRAGPTFPGYLKDGKLDTSAFNRDGWFDTGDLGWLDQDGYLFLTGRGKEVINRGGEIISPFEVEEAIMIAIQDSNSILFGRIQQVMAFSAPHALLQEVVGVVLVTVQGQPRPDTRDLQAALKSSLHSSKWPVVIVYMDALPISNNKLIRINFAERMNMKPVTNNAKLIEKHFEALCPPINSPLSVKISNSTCEMDFGLLEKELKKTLYQGSEVHVGRSHHDATPILYLAPRIENDSTMLSKSYTDTLADLLRKVLDGFLLPSSIITIRVPLPRDTLGLVDEKQLDEIVHAQKFTNSSVISDTEEKIRRGFSAVLNFDVDEISNDSDFFELGGDSLSAGQLLSILRRDLQVRLPVDKIFTSSKVHELCKLVDQLLALDTENLATEAPSMLGCTKTYSSTHPLVLLVHLLPTILFYPMKQAFKWMVLMYVLAWILKIWSEPDIPSRFVALMFALLVSRLATQIVAPIFGICFKYLVIGTYKEGMYPMWGVYHTRWWIVEKVLQICGKGVFRHFDATRILYYRILGAKIGSGVTIEKGTVLGEFDLLNIRDNVHLDRCICRPFAAEINTSMYLGKIEIGQNSSVGLKTHIAAGSTIPPDTFIGANSSSYEMDDMAEYNASRNAKPHILVKLFCILPIQVLVLFISALPWMGGLCGMVMGETTGSATNVKSVINWWAKPHRIAFHYLAQALHVAARPFVRFTLLILIKRAVDNLCGVGKPIAAADRTQKDIFRSHLLLGLVPHGPPTSITKLFGKHYEFTSMAIRALGGKVGQRVYWPGTGPTIGDIDLLEVGDDVVFGSRSHIITSDASGSDFVTIGSGAMIADRVILSPGANVGDRAVIGSGAFIKRGQKCAPESVLVGNRKGSALCLSSPSNLDKTSCKMPKELKNPPPYPDSVKGNSGFSSPSSYHESENSTIISKENFFTVDITQESSDSEPKSLAESSSSSNSSFKEPRSTSTPFGRAFYEGKAPYHVLGQATIFFYSTFIAIFVQLYWNVSTISTIIISQLLNNDNQFNTNWYQPLKIYTFSLAFLSALYTILSVISLFVVIAAKWLLLGRRKPGSYDWDKSSYCQRWQILLTIETIRRRYFGGSGVLGMLTGSHFIVLYFRALGANIGKDCALFAGGRPSLMFTEPDLLTMGNRVAVDDASLVGHINSRGHFSLNELKVGSGSVLRSGSRLLSGATMGENAVLLEHTLVMAGDLADDGTVYQGWPADVYRGDRFRVRSRMS